MDLYRPVWLCSFKAKRHFRPCGTEHQRTDHRHWLALDVHPINIDKHIACPQRLGARRGAAWKHSIKHQRPSLVALENYSCQERGLRSNKAREPCLTSTVRGGSVISYAEPRREQNLFRQADCCGPPCPGQCSPRDSSLLRSSHGQVSLIGRLHTLQWCSPAAHLEVELLSMGVRSRLVVVTVFRCAMISVHSRSACSHRAACTSHADLTRGKIGIMESSLAGCT